MHKNVVDLNLTDALREGADAEDLLEDFKRALKDAQNEVSKEALDDVRGALANSIMEYLYELGCIDKDTYYDEGVYDSIVESLEKMEKSLKNIKTLTGALDELLIKSLREYKDVDNTIKIFVKDL